MFKVFCVPLVFAAVGVSILVSAQSGTAANSKTSSDIPRELLEKRLAAARNVFRLDLERLKSQQAIPDDRLLSWSERWLDAELALTDVQADRIAALKSHLERAKEVEKIATAYAKTGQIRDSDAQGATYFRINAEIRLMHSIPN